MSLTSLAAKMANELLEEQSVSNIATSSSELDKTTFLSSDVCHQLLVTVSSKGFYFGGDLHMHR
jgi:hypothetical protein